MHQVSYLNNSNCQIGIVFKFHNEQESCMRNVKTLAAAFIATRISATPSEMLTKLLSQRLDAIRKTSNRQIYIDRLE